MLARHRRQDLGQLAAAAGRAARGARRRARRRLGVRRLHRGRHRRAHRGAKAPTSTRPQAVTYGVSADEARRFGLPCGGTIQLVLEPLHRDSRHAASCSTLRSSGAARRAHASISRRRRSTLHPARAARRARLRRTDADHRSTGRATGCWSSARRSCRKYLAQIAVGLDYQVTDLRSARGIHRDVGHSRRHARAARCPTTRSSTMKLDERCAVVALTHDPKLDDLALMEALKSPAFYVGALGSRANNAKRRERLREFDLTRRSRSRGCTGRSGSTSAAARRRRSRSRSWPRSPR